MQFKKGKFEIALGWDNVESCKRTVEGWVCGPFGIHGNFDIFLDKTSYELDNIPLGWKIASCRSLKKAMNLASDLSHLNWEFKNISEFKKSETRKLAPEIIKKWSIKKKDAAKN